MSSNKKKIGIVGSGLIGRSFAMLFAGANYNVVIYDVDQNQIKNALADIKQQLKMLEENGLLRGKLNAQQQFALIKGVNSLEEVVKNAYLVQECVPENLETKKKAWRDIDALAGSNTIYSSSTSAFVPSLFTKDLKHRQNVIVSHPINPPYYAPLIEIIPAPWTDPEIVKKTRTIMTEIGQTPVTFSKEIVGFAINRLQYALLNEVWHLVTEGILNVEDIDKVMSDGLGMRYAFLGPLETTHLNAEGFVNYCERYADTMHSVSEDFKPPPAKYDEHKVKEIARQLEAMVPLDKLQERRNWRDLCLAKLSLLKKEMQEEWK
ncbi:lambda-crystallin homolog [Anoplophora glabripennis]|nr:lambda-crystallin homolog [Anoplophora glabripennis]